MIQVHIAIDLTGLMSPATGVDVYMRQLVAGLSSIDGGNRYTLLVRRESRAALAGQLPSNFRLREFGWNSRLARGCFQQCVLPALARRERFDVVHSPAFVLPLLSGWPRHLLTVHDMTFFRMPQLHNRLRSSRPFLWAVRRSIRRANLITVPSRATQSAPLEEMPRLDPARIRVIPHGIEEHFSPAEPARVREALDRLGLPFSYLLFVGTLEPRKNLRLLVQSYRRLIAEQGIAEHLILAGKSGWSIDGLERDLRSPDLAGRVHRLGYVPHQDLLWLYRGARAFVYPSLAEGFGFPPLEAMACGAPVIAADNSALAENLSGAAELVRGNDAAQWTLALRALLASPQSCEELRRKGLARAAQFRWSRAAAAVLELYGELDRSTPAASDLRHTR